MAVARCRGEMLKLGCGWLPGDWMPNAAIRRAVRGLTWADSATLASHGSTRGSLSLRRFLGRQFAVERTNAGADQVLVTASGTQAIDLICHLLPRPGDTVLVDAPYYFDFQALLRAHWARPVGVPYTPTGPDLPLFEGALAAHRPRLYITNSALHNPTGATLSPQTAHRLLNAAAAGSSYGAFRAMRTLMRPPPSYWSALIRSSPEPANVRISRRPSPRPCFISRSAGKPVPSS